LLVFPPCLFGCLVAAPSTMKFRLTEHMRSIRKLIEEKEKEREKERVPHLKGACTTAMNQMCKRLFSCGTDIVCDGFLNGPEDKLASTIRHTIDTNPNRGYIILQNPWGLGHRALRKEATWALEKYEILHKKVNYHKTYKGFMEAIHASGGHVGYIDLYFYDHHTYRTTPYYKFKFPVERFYNPEDLPDVGLYHEETEQFLHCKLITKWVHLVLYRRLAGCIPGKELMFIKGALINTTEGIEWADWPPKGAVFHQDFPKEDDDEREVDPLTVMTCLGGETPLDMGPVAKNPKASDEGIKVKATVAPQAGDTCIFSWRQWHRTGTPRKFPTTENLRMHFMLSNREKDVDGEAITQLHPNRTNMHIYEEYKAKFS